MQPSLYSNSCQQYNSDYITDTSRADTSDVSIILQELTDTSIASYITIGCVFIYTHSTVGTD